jgi:hypothetical protein
MATTIDLSIVVPAYNEARRLPNGLGRLNEAIGAGAIDPSTTEIIVVDDGSTDGTEARVRQLLAHLPHVAVLRQSINEGKGAAIRHGVAAATGSMIAFGDADMAIDPDQFPKLVDALGRAEVAIGSRTLPGARSAGGSAHRKVMGRIFNCLVNQLTHLGIRDTQCGFKGFRAPVARLLFHCSVIDGFAFDVEILYMARQLGFGIEEVPVSWCNAAGTRIRPLADPFVMSADIVGGWIGRRAPAPIPALVVAPSPNGSSATRIAARAARGRYPVLAEPDGGAIVLLPLADEAQIDAVRSELLASGLDGSKLDSPELGPPELGRSDTGASADHSAVRVHATLVSTGSLRDRAPLRLVDVPARTDEVGSDVLGSLP